MCSMAAAEFILRLGAAGVGSTTTTTGGGRGGYLVRPQSNTMPVLAQEQRTTREQSDAGANNTLSAGDRAQLTARERERGLVCACPVCRAPFSSVQKLHVNVRLKNIILSALATTKQDAESYLDLQGQLDCCVCLQTLYNPVTLSCGHGACALRSCYVIYLLQISYPCPVSTRRVPWLPHQHAEGCGVKRITTADATANWIWRD